jgi:hypothetical protein
MQLRECVFFCLFVCFVFRCGLVVWVCVVFVAVVTGGIHGASLCVHVVSLARFFNWA